MTRASSLMSCRCEKVYVSLRTGTIVAVGLAVFLCAGCGDSTESSATAMTPGDNSEEQPCVLTSRWVLRDKNGDAVEALVEPRCGHRGLAEANERCLSLDFGSANSFSCVRIIDLQGKFINLQFDLESGRLEPCMYGGGGVGEEFKNLGAFFLDDKCEGDPYTLLNVAKFGGAQFTLARDLLFAEGDIWYVLEDGCIEAEISYQYDPQDGECFFHVGDFLCPYAPVPMWVRDLLPNAPYTLHVEYQ